MSQFAPLSGRAVRRVTGPALQSTALFSWHARLATLTAVTGQTGTLTQPSETSVDSNGATYTGAIGRPLWLAYASWTPAPNPLVTGLYLRPSGSVLTWPLEFLPQSLTVLLEGINTNGATPVNGGGIFHLGNDAATGNALSVVGTATTFQAVLTTGAGTVTSTLSEPMGNFRFRVAVQVEDNGTTQRVRIGGSLNETTFVWGTWSSTLTRASTFPSGSKVRLNRVGSGGTFGNNWFRRASVFPGLLSIDEMAARL